jgi:hypothetical protein
MKFRLTALPSDPCLYSGKIDGFQIYLALYVDDLISACKSRDVLDKLKGYLQSHFTLKDLGALKFCLGFEVNRNRAKRQILLHQTAFAKDILDRALMTDCKPRSTPMVPGILLHKSMSPQSNEEKEFMSKVPYRNIVGALLYLVSGTRPDLAFAVHQVCRHMQNPGKPHWEAVKQILRYLKGTLNQGIALGGPIQELEGFCDSDWGTSLSGTRKSCTGYIFYLNGSPISWSSKLQSCAPALSSTEAEYIALATTSQEAI